MKSKYYFLFTLLLVSVVSITSSSAQNVKYIKVPDLEKILSNPENKLFVINFWATWCPPCIAELPHFERVAKDSDPAKVKFILVSIDFPSQIEKQLIPFLKKNKISQEVAVMTDIDYNSWIDKIDPSWQGNIPSTLFINNSKKIRFFRPEEIDESELRRLITSFL